MAYILIAVAGWLSTVLEGFNSTARLWRSQKLLNWTWTPTFVGSDCIAQRSSAECCG
ncbi:hypothetical protein JZX87_23345 [Agrobacterium sp. Ap1]|nr:hypothetical protein [Agrobacterium sp. Ap1]